MLKRATICVAVLSFLVVLGLPIAQARTDQLMAVHVPFDFALRDRVLPAGDYTVRQFTGDGAAIIIRSADRRETMIVLTLNDAAEGQQPHAPRLVFRRYGDQYFLASVWINADEGRALPASRRERSLRKELAQTGREVTPDVVTLLAATAVQ